MNTLLIKLIGVALFSSLFVAGTLTGGFDNIVPLDNNVEPLSWSADQLDATEPLLTEDQVLLIALENEEVSGYIEATEADHSLYFDGFGIWIVSFYPGIAILEFQEYLDVYIDDNTSEIIEVIYISDEYIFEEDPVLTEAVMEYLTTSEITSNFLSTHENMEWYVFNWDGMVNAWMSNYETNIWLSANLFADEVDTDTWDFELIDVTASAVFGSPNHSFEDALAIAMDSPEVIEFVTDNVEYQVTTTLSYTIDGDYFYDEGLIGSGYNYFLEFSSGEMDEPIDDFPGTNAGSDSVTPDDWNETWMIVTIDDAIGEIVDIWGTAPAEMTEDEVISIVLAIPEIDNWLGNFVDYEIFAYYDGFGAWYVDIYIEWDYAYVIVDDITGEIIEVEIYQTVPSAMTENEVVDIVLAAPEVQDWLLNVSDYEVYTYYDGYGFWWVDLYDSTNFYNYISAEVDDQTGELTYLDVFLAEPAEMTEEEVLQIALESGMNDFLNLYENAEIEAYYDGNSLWYVFAYSPVLIDAWAWAEIDDLSGDVISYEENHPLILPTMSVEEILVIVHSTSNYTDFVLNLVEVYEDVIFYDGLWYVNIGGYNIDDGYLSLCFTIDDATGDILEIFECWMMEIY